MIPNSFFFINPFTRKSSRIPGAPKLLGLERLLHMRKAWRFFLSVWNGVWWVHEAPDNLPGSLTLLENRRCFWKLSPQISYHISKQGWYRRYERTLDKFSLPGYFFWHKPGLEILAEPWSFGGRCPPKTKTKQTLSGIFKGKYLYIYIFYLFFLERLMQYHPTTP